MDYVLGIVIVICILALGAIVSTGNERQRKALENIRKQIEAWTMEDLRMRRAAAAREIQILDPRAWLEETAQRVFGSPQGIQEPEVWRENGTAAIVARAEEGRSLVFTPIPPQRFIKALNQRKRLGSAQVAVLGKKPRRAACTELSVLNSGPFFDLEAQQVWQKLAGEKLPIDRLWMFEVRN